MCFLFPLVSCFLLFFKSCLFAFYLFFVLYRLREKLTNFKRNKKYIARNTIIDKTIAKELKAKGKKQETGNKKYIVE